MQEFTITQDHLTLVKNMIVSWDHCEFGAPAVDCKRPYGNSCVEQDIIEILGWADTSDEAFHEGDYEDMFIEASDLHAETEYVLQICFQRLSFETGTFRRENSWDEWEKVE